MTDDVMTPESEPEERRYFGPSSPATETSAEEAERAFQERGPTPQAVGDPPRYSKKVGEGDAEQRFPARTLEEAEASLDQIVAFCRDCPINHHCAEEECAVYRAEAKALAVIEADEARTAEAGVTMALPGA